MKFFNSAFFNVILAVLAAVLVIMQEVWIGNPMSFLNNFALGSLVGIGFSWCADVLKNVFFNNKGKFNYLHIGIGCIFAIVAALITSLLLI